MKHIYPLVSSALALVFITAACAPVTSTAAPESNNNPAAAATATFDLACAAGQSSASVTRELTEGPYYTANTPERDNLYEQGMAGIKLVITGHVYDSNCQTVANAWLDFWQADSTGNYDNSGYTLRGHQYTDSEGRYELTTVIPGIYPGRTEHIHLKVQAPGGNIITSQLFFPEVAQNEGDSIYDASLLLSIQETADGFQAQYNFVVPAQ